MVLAEAFPDLDRRDIRILATDISSQVLEKARAGIYSEPGLDGVPDALRRRYFQRMKDPRTGLPHYQILPELRALIAVARLNLMERWPMAGPFDFILCRNVMIYFDKGTRTRLLQRFTELLTPGGHLMVGHSESLNSMRHQLKYIQPAVYRK